MLHVDDLFMAGDKVFADKVLANIRKDFKVVPTFHRRGRKFGEALPGPSKVRLFRDPNRSTWPGGCWYVPGISC